MQRAVVVLFGFILGLLLSIAILMYGWGLEPKSWWWIIGGGVGLRTILVTVEAMGKGK